LSSLRLTTSLPGERGRGEGGAEGEGEDSTAIATPPRALPRAPTCVLTHPHSIPDSVLQL
jgi:hypothetical protein